jgi:hypothetical protein
MGSSRRVTFAIALALGLLIAALVFFHDARPSKALEPAATGTETAPQPAAELVGGQARAKADRRSTPVEPAPREVSEETPSNILERLELSPYPGSLPLCELRGVVLEEGWTAGQLIAAAETPNIGCAVRNSAVTALAWAADYDQEAAEWLRTVILRVPPLPSMGHGGGGRSSFGPFRALAIRGDRETLEHIVLQTYDQYRRETHSGAQRSLRIDIIHALNAFRPDDEVLLALEPILNDPNENAQLRYALWEAMARSEIHSWPARVLESGKEGNGQAREAFRGLSDPAFTAHLRELFPSKRSTSYGRYINKSALEGMIGIGDAECVRLLIDTLANPPSFSWEIQRALSDGRQLAAPRPSALGGLLQVQAALEARSISHDGLNEYVAEAARLLGECDQPAFEVAGALASFRVAIPLLPTHSAQLTTALELLTRLGTPSDLGLIEQHIAWVEMTPELAISLERLRHR